MFAALSPPDPLTARCVGGWHSSRECRRAGGGGGRMTCEGYRVGGIATVATTASCAEIARFGHDGGDDSAAPPRP